MKNKKPPKEKLEGWFTQIERGIRQETLKKVIEMLPKEFTGRFEDDFVAGKKEQGYFRNGYNQCLQDLKSKLNKL